MPLSLAPNIGRDLGLALDALGASAEIENAFVVRIIKPHMFETELFVLGCFLSISLSHTLSLCFCLCKTSSTQWASSTICACFPVSNLIDCLSTSHQNCEQIAVEILFADCVHARSPRKRRHHVVCMRHHPATWADWLPRAIVEFEDSENSRVNVHVGPYRRKFLGTYGGWVDVEVSPSSLRGT